MNDTQYTQDLLAGIGRQVLSPNVKRCKTCGEVKSLSEFHRNKGFKDGRNSRCVECGKKIRNIKVDLIRMRYGISEEQYKAMLQHQDNRCNICRTPFGNGRDLCIDHCHETMRIRGLLCRKCNAALGLFGENLVTLQRAINHIKQPEDSSAVIIMDSQRLLKRGRKDKTLVLL